MSSSGGKPSFGNMFSGLGDKMKGLFNKPTPANAAKPNAAKPANAKPNTKPANAKPLNSQVNKHADLGNLSNSSANANANAKAKARANAQTAQLRAMRNANQKATEFHNQQSQELKKQNANSVNPMANVHQQQTQPNVQKQPASRSQTLLEKLRAKLPEKLQNELDQFLTDGKIDMTKLSAKLKEQLEANKIDQIQYDEIIKAAKPGNATAAVNASKNTKASDKECYTVERNADGMPISVTRVQTGSGQAIKNSLIATKERVKMGSKTHVVYKIGNGKCKYIKKAGKLYKLQK